jgi:hypothetical protein
MYQNNKNLVPFYDFNVKNTKMWNFFENVYDNLLCQMNPSIIDQKF